MVWAAASTVVSTSNRNRTARARDYSTAAILSNNPVSVSLRTFVAETPCKHWRSAETRFRCPHTRQRVKRLLEASRRLSAAITAANQSGQASLSVSAEFSLFCLAILAGILDIDTPNSLHHIVRPRFASHSAAAVCIIQGGCGKHHIVRHR